MKKVIVTVVGRDTVGIIARICTYMAAHHINILDISQTIVGGFFNMMMVVDTAACDVSFEQMSDDLGAEGKQIGVVVKCQREDIFDSMHRV